MPGDADVDVAGLQKETDGSQPSKEALQMLPEAQIAAAATAAKETQAEPPEATTEPREQAVTAKEPEEAKAVEGPKANEAVPPTEKPAEPSEEAGHADAEAAKPADPAQPAMLEPAQPADVKSDSTTGPVEAVQQEDRTASEQGASVEAAQKEDSSEQAVTRSSGQNQNEQRRGEATEAEMPGEPASKDLDSKAAVLAQPEPEEQAVTAKEPEEAK
ncbi:unnamed protein product, partial [Symbiodinium sp. CCMP2456]